MKLAVTIVLVISLAICLSEARTRKVPKPDPVEEVEEVADSPVANLGLPAMSTEGGTKEFWDRWMKSAMASVGGQSNEETEEGEEDEEEETPKPKGKGKGKGKDKGKDQDDERMDSSGSLKRVKGMKATAFAKPVAPTVPDKPEKPDLGLLGMLLPPPKNEDVPVDDEDEAPKTVALPIKQKRPN